MEPTSWQECDTIWNETRKRKLANNTYLEKLETGYGIKLHDTVVVVFSREGLIVLNSGGWLTVTTKERMNRYLPPPWSIYQKDRVWYVWNRQTDKSLPYADGFTINTSNGTADGAGPDPKESLKLKRRLKRYSKRYIDALAQGNVEAPSNGDCFYCLMRTVDGNIPLGESVRSTEHLESHLKENYYVPSLLVRAIETIPVSPFARSYLGAMWQGGNGDNSGWIRGIATEQLKKSLYRYLCCQFGLAR
jgi:hypothetical protein